MNRILPIICFIFLVIVFAEVYYYFSLNNFASKDYVKITPTIVPTLSPNAKVFLKYVDQCQNDELCSKIVLSNEYEGKIIKIDKTYIDKKNIYNISLASKNSNDVENLLMLNSSSVEVVDRESQKIDFNQLKSGDYVVINTFFDYTNNKYYYTIKLIN